MDAGATLSTPGCINQPKPPEAQKAAAKGTHSARKRAGRHPPPYLRSGQRSAQPPKLPALGVEPVGKLRVLVH